ncbi:ubiquinol-cytochrome c reductase iron-sulfur subunit [Crocosphaera sp. XPORK-15E]|uniref:QcrA and Rieske domain-containing protein n=1 Tax=Crocosphaera sp. XPORK-15E TaxID=3110247 RepID=UPI002B1F990E|nr:ubiquinol-cytochrome c reductase iron-sulfur subunit [Crocosphaera sp. XPORK-15E]MEA5534334.1 ubiquinol-cytochrome c reductase iron-sulfur subunit [Crocosphaera sp. XPORK-15E]
MMNRREFMGWVGVGGIASFLPVAIAACSPQTKSPATAPTSSSTGEFQTVGTLTELKEKGQILNEKFPGGAVLVVENGTDANGLMVVNPTCTHAGCTVTWEADNKIFDCPCHGSKFGADGKVVEGPAKDPLSTYQSKLEGDQILIKAKA